VNTPTPAAAPAWPYPPHCTICDRQMIKDDHPPAGWVAWVCGPHEPDNYMNVNLVKVEDDKKRKAAAA